MSDYTRQYMSEDIRTASGIPLILKDKFLPELETRNIEQQELAQKVDRFLHQKRSTEPFVWALSVLGTVGNGKTTIVGAAINWWNDRYWFYDHPAVYVTQSQLISQFKDTFDKNKSEYEVFTKYAKADVVVIDELSANDWSEYTKSQIQKVLVERHANKRLTILIGNVSMQAFSGMWDAHVRSRLREGIFQTMTAKDMREAPGGFI